MPDIFLSYSKKDKERASRFAEILKSKGWEVFWDQTIRSGDEWKRDLIDALKTTKSVVVLWSENSVDSAWVQWEAHEGQTRDNLFPVMLDDVGDKIPAPFQPLHAFDLINCELDYADHKIDVLLDTFEKKIGGVNRYLGLDPPVEGELVQAKHLALIHSSWRVPDRDSEFGGLKMYRIHVIVYGTAQALDRIDKVEFILHPSYRERSRQTGGERSRCFELKELAYGETVVEAHVKLKNQIESIRLRRYINLTETGPRLDERYMSQR